MLYYITIIASVLIGLSASTSFQERIVGGVATVDTELQYVVSVQVNREHKCGGVLIDPRWVVTAAHCVYKVSKTIVRIEFGNRVIGGPNPNIAIVRNIYWHEDYKPEISSNNDIALLELTTGINNIVPVALPVKYDEVVPLADTGIMAGWGYLENGGDVQTGLRKLEVNIIDPADCKSIHYKPIFSTNVCTLPLGGRRGQCRRDGGGPVVIDDVLIGIIVWSVKPCATSPYPGVHMKVSHYICWINEKTRLNFP